MNVDVGITAILVGSVMAVAGSGVGVTAVSGPGEQAANERKRKHIRIRGRLTNRVDRI
jgi:hypothetical protein